MLLTDINIKEVFSKRTLINFDVREGGGGYL